MKYITDKHKFPTLSLPSTHILNTQSILLYAQTQCSFMNISKRLSVPENLPIIQCECIKNTVLKANGGNLVCVVIFPWLNVIGFNQTLSKYLSLLYSKEKFSLYQKL